MQPTLLTGLIKYIPSPIYKFLAKRYIDYAFPRHLFIETTQACQLSCSFCPRPQESKEMSWDLFTKIIDEASLYGPRSFSLHLFGEPLLWGRICEGILYIKKRNRRHTVLLTTNGILLNEFSDKLIKCGVDKIIWTYRRLGGNRFTDKTLHSLRKIATCRILKETMGDKDWEESERIPWKKEIKEIHNYGGNIKSLDSKTCARYACYHLWLAPAIRWNGDFTICCNDAKGNQVIGNISGNRNSINSIWNDIVINRFRLNQIKGIYEGICKECNCWKTYPSLF